MDRLVYTAMTGAKHILEQQATNAHNLANATTTGFKAQLDSFRAIPVESEGMPTRTFVVDSTVGADFSAGSIQTTGRTLDVAIQGDGWIAVGREDGAEGYTRNGALKVNENGLLQTEKGQNIQGDGGPITIPPDVTIAIAKDGTISTVSNTTAPGASNIIGRIKLVNPPVSTMERGADGLFNLKAGGTAEVDANVNLVSGALESSNVNVVDGMVNMINLARQFDLQMKMMQNAENNAEKASQLLSLT